MAPEFAGYNEHFKVLMAKRLSYWWGAGFGESAHFPVGLGHAISLTFITPPPQTHSLNAFGFKLSPLIIWERGNG